MKIINDNWAIGRPFCSLTKQKSQYTGWYTTGEYIHKNGAVLIYQQGHEEGESKFLQLRIYKDGRMYLRQISGKLYTNRGIARKASEFVQEVYFNNKP